jgi:Rieske Fe-S protein
MARNLNITRRSALLLGGAGTAAVFVGCSASPGTGANSVTSNNGAPVEVAKLADIPVGGSLAVTLDGAPILLSQPTDGEVLAFSAICPHQGCVAAPAEGEFLCLCHNSSFDLTSGDVLGGPANRPLDSLTVTVDGDSVIVG